MSGTEARPSGLSYDLHLGGRCELSCAVCDCRNPATSESAIARALDGRVSRVLLRGAGPDNPRLVDVVRAARARKVAEIVVRTNALAYMTLEAAQALAALGVDAVLVPLFSSVTSVHDRIAGRPSALAHALVGMRALAQAGLAVDLEVPLLSPRIQDLVALVVLAHRAVPALRAVRFFHPPSPMPPALAPPTWAEGAPALAAAIRLCRQLAVEARLGVADGVPLCALRDTPDLLDVHRFNPKAKTSLANGATYAAACGGCAVRGQCPGVARSYRAAHNEVGLAPYSKKPRLMYAQRSPGAPVFTPEHRRASANVRMLVLRPTVNCNQDCTFCSANETSGNVWTESGEMLRAIARAARRGVARVSFSGGEPTLSRDLVHYVAAARRLGIENIEVVTNAVLLDNPSRATALRTAGLTHAFVSLHAHDERISRVMTQKMDDHAKTVQGIRNLVAAGVETVVNHVITARNYAYLTRFVEFVREELGADVGISFAFVTPQYKALQDLSQVPRLSEVMPYLRRAIHRAIELRQPVVVGSRQGIPPCFLGELAGWSDVMLLVNEAASEDAPQKQRAPACDDCKFTRQCTGLWRPYAMRYGLSELTPVPGAPFTDDELFAIRHTAHPSQGRTPASFEKLHPRMRDLALEVEGRALYEADRRAPPPIRSLPVYSVSRSRPVRIALVGSGRQARRLARAARNVSGISVDAVVSPGAPDADLRDFGGCPALRSLDEAISEFRPEAVIIAAATHAHHALARLALEHGIPALLEKPLARTDDEGADLVRAVAERRGAVLVPAHNMVFAAGVDALLDADGMPSIVFSRRSSASGPDAMRAWSRASLSETLYHALSLVGRAAGGGVPTVSEAQHAGSVAPERIRLALTYPRGDAEITLDFDAGSDETLLSRRTHRERPPSMTWRRAGASTSLRIGDAEVAVPRDGSDVERMLAHFRDVVLGKTLPRVTAAEALDIMRATRVAIAALEAAGAPFDRADAPRHVASPGLIAFPRSPGAR